MEPVIVRHLDKAIPCEAGQALKGLGVTGRDYDRPRRPGRYRTGPRIGSGTARSRSILHSRRIGSRTSGGTDASNMGSLPLERTQEADPPSLRRITDELEVGPAEERDSQRLIANAQRARLR
jgi:hypothetical protein